jgi:uncharacterized circularly permuted ATP-grasp superfamily protein
MSTEALLQQYKLLPDIWDEMSSTNGIRNNYNTVVDALKQFSAEDLQQKDRLAAELFMNQGITFTVYSNDEGIERIFPFDIIPRIITSKEWEHVETGIKQRLKALNFF